MFKMEEGMKQILGNQIVILKYLLEHHYEKQLIARHIFDTAELLNPTKEESQ